MYHGAIQRQPEGRRFGASSRSSRHPARDVVGKDLASRHARRAPRRMGRGDTPSYARSEPSLASDQPMESW